jgi:hypothetical protein
VATFSWRETARGYARIYDDLLGRQPTAACA